MINKKIVIGGLIVVAVVGLYMLASRKTNDEAMQKEEAAMEAAKKTTGKAPVSKPKVVNVTIKDFAFSEKFLKVPVGTTVRWTNLDSVGHTVTSDQGYFDSKLFGQGQTFEYTFTAKASYPYKCTPHPNMTGTVLVE